MGFRITERYLALILIFVIVLAVLYFGRPKINPEIAKLPSSYELNPGLLNGAEVASWYWQEPISGDSFKYNVPSEKDHKSHANHPSQLPVLETELSLLDYLDTELKQEGTFDFAKCRMSNCFDFSRCSPSGPLTVHIVPLLSESSSQPEANKTIGESNLIHGKILDVIRNSRFYTTNRDEACLFVPQDDTLDRDPLSQSYVEHRQNFFGPSQMYGINHIVFNLYSGTWPDYREDDFSGLNVAAALLAKASNSIHHFRSNFDISLPLFSFQHPRLNSNYTGSTHQLDPEWLNSKNRSLFLTFKGKRYVFGAGSDTRNNLYHIDNQRDVIMLTTCRHGKKWRDLNDRRCDIDESNYANYDFVELMKDSQFCLVPRGRRLGSFRFLEALSLGCVPVIMSDGWVEPFGELIDWSEATLRFDERLLLQVPDLLRDLKADQVARLRANGLRIYQRYFSSIDQIILTALTVIEKRIKNELGNSSIANR